jgi:hypothetical protein
MPLYTFAQDRSPGEANGQGIKDVGTWKAVTAKTGTSSAPASSSSAPSSTTKSSSEGGRVGY